MSGFVPWTAFAPEKLLVAVFSQINDSGIKRAPTPADERRISATLRFIDAKADRTLSLARLATHAQMSEFHFLRVFRQVTAVTPHQYVLRSRLRDAALRLRYPRGRRIRDRVGCRIRRLIPLQSRVSGRVRSQSDSIQTPSWRQNRGSNVVVR